MNATLFSVLENFKNLIHKIDFFLYIQGINFPLTFGFFCTNNLANR